MNKDLKKYTNLEIKKEYHRRWLNSDVKFSLEELSDWIKQGHLVFDSEKNTLTFKSDDFMVELDLEKNKLKTNEKTFQKTD